MTRKEAIEILRDWDGYFVGHGSDDVNEALEMAIKALEECSQKVLPIAVIKLDSNEVAEEILKKIKNGEWIISEVSTDQTNVLNKIKTEIKEWYWQADKQKLAKDPCVVDAMVDLFIRTINKYTEENK